jgi:hypothetical protein
MWFLRLRFATRNKSVFLFGACFSRLVLHLIIPLRDTFSLLYIIIFSCLAAKHFVVEGNGT